MTLKRWQEYPKAYHKEVLAGKVDDFATLYALRVLRKEIVAGPHVRGACQRHLNDLVRTDIVWDLEAAQANIEFFPDMLVFTDGDRAGEAFSLELWQAFIVGSLFGWKGLDGWRRFRTAYIEVGKGNGKSPLAGGIGIKLFVADREAAAEVYAAAPTLNQARILWTDAKRMVETSPILSDMVDVKVGHLAYLPNYSIFKPVSSEKRGLDGPRVHGGLIDELHEHADATVVDKIRAGTKARKQALIFEITNSGYDRTSVCYQHHEYILRILRGQEQNDTWFGYICALDEDDDWETDEACWVKANPNLGVSITKKYLRELVAEAKGVPSKRSIVERLNFCKWVGALSPWMSEMKWRKCPVDGSKVNWALLKAHPCWVGVDLSSVRDLTAIAMVWKLQDRVLGRVFYFMPEDGLEDRVKEDKVQYDVWAREGWLTLTPGAVVDYAFVAAKLKELQAEFQIKEVAFDPWRIKYLEAELSKVSCQLPLRPHGQGFQGGKDDETVWMPTALEKFEQIILEGEYTVEDNPMTTMCVANATTRSDPAGNRKFEKQKATGRMDGTVAQAMAIGAAFFIPGKPPEGPSVYEKREMLAL